MKTKNLFFMLVLAILGGIAEANAQTSNENAVIDPPNTVLGSAIKNLIIGDGAAESLIATPGTANPAQGNYNNVFLGIDAGRNSNFLTGGENGRNTYVGFGAGYRDAFNENRGSDNIFLGHKAGWTNTSGERNVIIQSLRSPVAPYGNLTGSSNSIIGHQAGEYLTAGANNVFFGAASGQYTGSGSNNLFLGNFAGNANTMGSNNVAVGSGAIIGGSAEYNTSVGVGTGGGLATGGGNTLLGARIHGLAAGLENTIILANGADFENQKVYITPNGFTGIGLGDNQAPLNRLEINPVNAVPGTTGLRFRGLSINQAAGPNLSTTVPKVLSLNTDGDVILVNDATGTAGTNDDWHLAGNAGTSPSLLRDDTAAPSNFLGTTGDQDLVFRRNRIRSGLIQAPGAAPGGTRFMSVGNTSFGFDSLSQSLLTGGSNTAMGVNSLLNATTGIGNVAVGTNALMNSRQDIGNVAIGYNALSGLMTQAAFPTSTWLSNIAIGSFAGANLQHGNGNVFIGTDAGPVPAASGQVNAFSNKLYIDTDTNVAQRGNNTPLIFGDFATRNLIFNLNNENGTPNTTSRVTINSGGTNLSGLKFADLNSASPAAPNLLRKVLTADAAGDVVLVNDASLYDDDGTINTTGDDYPGIRIVTMADNNLFFNTGESATGFGKVYIGELASFPADEHYRLYVEDGILAERAKVAMRSTANWQDHVFANDYKLMPLSEIESFVNKNKHLPGIESAEELVKNGLDLGAMQSKQMGKIEELTLHAIEQEKRLEKQSKEIEELKAMVKLLLEKK